MYSMSCDILCIESWNVPWNTFMYGRCAWSWSYINIFRVTQSRSVCGAGYGSCSDRFRCSSLATLIQFIKYNFRSQNCHCAWDAVHLAAAARVRIVLFAFAIRISHGNKLISLLWFSVSRNFVRATPTETHKPFSLHFCFCASTIFNSHRSGRRRDL